MIIPSIDIMKGEAVQLKQGKKLALKLGNPIAIAKRLRIYGELQVIDLDAALGKGENTEIIKQICRIAECRVGGGIRTEEKAREYLGAGAKKLIIGTSATPAFLKKLPKGMLIVALDAEKGRVVNKGWKEKTGCSPLQLAKKTERYCSEFLYTIVDKEGLMQGTDIEAVKALCRVTDKKISVAGGIATISEIKEIEKLGANSVLGMALYTKKIDPVDALLSTLNFEKGPLPTITRDESGQILMVAFSSRESIRETLETGKATYYSRTRRKLWTKGETSGNYQSVINVKKDCDSDSLLFTVSQKNFACHAGSYSCFGEREFGLNELYETIAERLREKPKGSYTAKLSMKNVLEKLSEECREVISSATRDNAIWEIADLLYFLTVFMAKKKITYAEVMAMLRGRTK